MCECAIISELKYKKHSLRYAVFGYKRINGFCSFTFTHQKSKLTMPCIKTHLQFYTIFFMKLFYFFCYLLSKLKCILRAQTTPSGQWVIIIIIYTWFMCLPSVNAPTRFRRVFSFLNTVQQRWCAIDAITQFVDTRWNSTIHRFTDGTHVYDTILHEYFAVSSSDRVPRCAFVSRGRNPEAGPLE
jgi:hypothetical protein